MGVRFLAQEHNTVPQPGLEPGPFDPESCALTIRPPRLPQRTVTYSSGQMLTHLNIVLHALFET